MNQLIRRMFLERRGITSILSTSVISTVTSFATILLFANLIETSALGTYQYIISVVSILSAFTLTGLTNSVVRAIGKKEYWYLPVAKKYFLVGLIPLVLLSFFAGIYYIAAGNVFLGGSILIAGIINVFILFQTRYIYILTALDKLKEANHLLKAAAVGPLVFLAPSLFFIDDPHILAIIYFMGLFLGPALYIGYFKLKHLEFGLSLEKINSISYSPKRIIELLHFGFHQSVINLINNISAHADKIIIFQILGAEQTALYFIAITIPNRIRSNLKQFEPWLFARFTKHTATAVRHGIPAKFFIGIVTSIPFIILYIVIAPYFFDAFMSQYVEIITLSSIYAISIFGSAAVIPYAALKAHASSSSLYIYTLISSTTQIIFVLLGAVLFGLYGAVIGKMLATLLNTLIILLLVLFLRQTTNSSHTVIGSTKESS